MCQKSSSPFSQSSVSPMAARFTKVTIILIFFCFAEYSAGGNLKESATVNKKKMSSCLSYGHSCWGAHGKRNNPTNKDSPMKEDSINDFPVDTRWFVSRLYNNQGPTDLRTWKIKDSAGRQHNIERQMIRENELAEAMKSFPEDDVFDYQDGVPEMLFPEESRSKPYQDRLRFYNYLRNPKLN